MGGGSYNRDDAVYRQQTVYKKKSREEIYNRNFMCPDMDPRHIKVRESRDSEEHPNSYPLYLILDQTGSMGIIPEILIKEILPDIIQSIIDAGIKDIQVNFMLVGDCDTGYELAPLQVGQFESSDSLMEKWLTSGYLEGLGGGNGFESYSLAWYFINGHTETDAWEKRHQKGVIISIGDDSCQRLLKKHSLDRYINDGAEGDVSIDDLLPTLQEKWHVFHIHCEGSKWGKYFEKTNWSRILGVNAVCSHDPEGRDIKDIIPRLVINAYRNETAIEDD